MPNNYTIKSGDTLSAIAKAQGTTVADLLKFNPNIQDPNRIYAGHSLNLTDIQPPQTPTMPEPTALPVQEQASTGIQKTVDEAQIKLDTELKKQRDDALERQDKLNQQLLELQKNSDPTQRETYEQEQKIVKNQLDLAERSSQTLSEDFDKRRVLVSELDQLMTESNQLINQARNAPMALPVLEKSVTEQIANVQARAGVVQAVMAGLDGNISLAQGFIDKAQSSVRAVWQEQLDYNNAYLSLVAGGELAKNDIHDKYAAEKVAQAKSNLAKVEETADYVKKLMINPTTAQLMADAGVSLNDSVEEIGKKLAEQVNKEVLIEEAKAYHDLAIQTGFMSPADVARFNELEGNPAAQRELAQKIIAQSSVDERALADAAKRASIAASATARRKNLVDLALFGDPSAIRELGFDPTALLKEAEEKERAEAEAEEKAEATKKADDEIKRLDDNIADIDRLLGNKVGLSTSSGVFRNAVISGALGGQIIKQQGGRETMFEKVIGVTPVVGNVVNAVSANQQKKDWLALVNTMATREGFESLIEINERVRLTPITEYEVNLAFRAANALNSARIEDKETKRLLGFSMSEEEVERNLNVIRKSFVSLRSDVSANYTYGSEGIEQLVELKNNYQSQ